MTGSVSGNGSITSPRHIWIVTGPAGCGKSTIAQFLADYMGVPYIEGDEYHPISNIRKMASGKSLTDEDRWDWLIAVRDVAAKVCNGDTGSSVVVACSALKKKYRDAFRILGNNRTKISVHFLYLSAGESILYSRVSARPGHFMKQDMVHSQFKDLEPPQDTERDCVTIDVSGSADTAIFNAVAVVSSIFDIRVTKNSS